MNGSLMRIGVGAGSFYIGDTDTHTFSKPYQTIIIMENGTSFDELLGKGKDEVEVDLLPILGIDASPALPWTRLDVFFIPDSYRITSITLGAGSVNLG